MISFRQVGAHKKPVGVAIPSPHTSVSSCLLLLLSVCHTFFLLPSYSLFLSHHFITLSFSFCPYYSPRHPPTSPDTHTHTAIAVTALLATCPHQLVSQPTTHFPPQQWQWQLSQPPATTLPDSNSSGSSPGHQSAPPPPVMAVVALLATCSLPPHSNGNGFPSCQPASPPQQWNWRLSEPATQIAMAAVKNLRLLRRGRTGGSGISLQALRGEFFEGV